jgi:phenylacetate-CoA ligase
MRYIPDFVVSLYEKSPIWTKSVYSTFYGLIKSYKESNNILKNFVDELIDMQWWDLDKLHQIQNQRLNRLLVHAYNTVPYYKKIFNEYGLSPLDIKSYLDLKKLPTLSKNTVRKEFNSLLSDKINLKTIRKEHTSGTTGTPLTIYLDDSTFLYARAIIKMHHLWAGYTGKEWIGIFSGYKIIPNDRKIPPFWIKNYTNKQIHFSTYHLNLKNVKSYFHALNDNKIEFLMGYPSSIGLIAKFINELIGIPIYLKGVFLGSEPIYDWQRENITKAFKCKIYDYYGQTENIIMASGCGFTKNLHLNLESGITELTKIEENKYNLIGTTLLNYSMPLIRYELNDVTGGFVEENCPCGRKHTQIKPIETKSEDFIITPNGDYISASILTFPFKTPKGIIESQIIQKSKDQLLINLIINDEFTEVEKQKLIIEINQCLGNNMKIYLNYVASIPRTNNGKFRFVINETNKTI